MTPAGDEVKYLLTKIQEFVIPWRPSPRPTPGVLYIQPNWAKSTDSQATEALALLDTLPTEESVIAGPEPTRKETIMKVFVSHSSVDKAVAEAFVELVRTALNLSSKDIRCTSVAGFKLPAGAHSNEQLRTEVFGCELFIALLSPASIKSVYVMFELGARWGTKRHLAPIMVAGTQPGDLKAPLSGIHSIDGTSESDLHQLLTEMGTELSLPVEGAATYIKALRAFVKAAKEAKYPHKNDENLPIDNFPELHTSKELLDEQEVKILNLLYRQDNLLTEQVATAINVEIQAAKFHLEELKSKGMASDHIYRPPQNRNKILMAWSIEQPGRKYLHNAEAKDCEQNPPKNFPKLEEFVFQPEGFYTHPNFNHEICPKCLHQEPMKVVPVTNASGPWKCVSCDYKVSPKAACASSPPEPTRRGGFVNSCKK